jgi:hypothetical protein
VTEPPEEFWDDRPPDGYREYRSDEVLHSVEGLLGDAIALRPGANWFGALTRASLTAERRDRAVPRRPPTHLVELFAS